MHEYEFRLWLADDPRSLDDWSHAVYEAGGDDSTCGTHEGRLLADFHREAASLEEAIRSAIKTIQAAGLQVEGCEIEVDSLAA